MLASARCRHDTDVIIVNRPSLRDSPVTSPRRTWRECRRRRTSRGRHTCRSRVSRAAVADDAALGARRRACRRRAARAAVAGRTSEHAAAAVPLSTAAHSARVLHARACPAVEDAAAAVSGEAARACWAGELRACGSRFESPVEHATKPTPLPRTAAIAASWWIHRIYVVFAYRA